MKHIKFALLFSAVVAVSAISVTFVQSSTIVEDEERVLYRHFGTEVPGMARLGLIDIKGNEYTFRDELIFPFELHISPDYSKVSFRTFEGDVYVADALSRLVVAQPLEFTTDLKWFEWLVWGWVDNQRLVLSHNLDSHLTFYELDLTLEQPSLQEFAYLNDFFIWNVASGQKFDGYALFQFDPTFEFMATQLTLGDDDWFSGDIYIWDILNSPEQPVEVIRDGFPWVMEPIRLPVWANVHQALGAFPIVREGPKLLIYSQKADDSVIDVPWCGTEKEQCYSAPAYPVWSPDDTQIAYWLEDFYRQDVRRRLVVVDVATGEQRTLLDVGRIVTDPVHWSPDGRYLALNVLHKINILDVETGEIILSQEPDFPSEVVGWVLVPSS